MMPLLTFSMDPETGGNVLVSPWSGNSHYPPPVTPLRFFGVNDDPEGPEALPFFGPFPYYFPSASPMVLVARREATAHVARGTGESEASATSRAIAAAIAALGTWEPYEPHLESSSIASSTSGGYDYSEGGVAYYIGYAEEYQVNFRVPPPYSSRAKLMWRLVEDRGGSQTNTDTELSLDPPAGVSYMGIPRCFPLAMADPMTDDHWHYLLETPAQLTAVEDGFDLATPLWWHSYRPPAT